MSDNPTPGLMPLADQLEKALPLLNGLETGQDCEEYAFATCEGMQAMTMIPEAFEALRCIPDVIAALRTQGGKQSSHTAGEGDDAYIAVAHKNLRHFLQAAEFKCSADKEAAVNCLDAIESEVADLNSLVSVLRSAFAASSALSATQSSHTDLEPSWKRSPVAASWESCPVCTNHCTQNECKNGCAIAQHKGQSG